jgi:putative methionine-R-sulfoxide reductase with GAF domain
MDTLGSLIPYDAAGIYLLQNSDTDGPAAFRSKVIRGYDISFELIEPRLKLGEGFLGRVAQSGKPIISPDVSADARYFPARKRTRSEMVAPIVSNEHVIGAFDLESDEIAAYTEEDLVILQMLTSKRSICRNRLSRKSGSRLSLRSRGKSNSNSYQTLTRRSRIST